MSKFDDALVLYKNEMLNKLGMESVDDALLKAVTKACGPSIYLRDASKVSCSEKGEINRVRKNFMIKKLGLEESEELDVALKEVCAAFGKGNRNKYRAIFYYLLTVRYGKESLFIG